MKHILIFILTIFILSACKHELERPTWNVDMIVPVVHAKMNINEMIY